MEQELAGQGRWQRSVNQGIKLLLGGNLHHLLDPERLGNYLLTSHSKNGPICKIKTSCPLCQLLPRGLLTAFHLLVANWAITARIFYKLGYLVKSSLLSVEHLHLHLSGTVHLTTNCIPNTCFHIWLTLQDDRRWSLVRG